MVKGSHFSFKFTGKVGIDEAVGRILGINLAEGQKFDEFLSKVLEFSMGSVDDLLFEFIKGSNNLAEDGKNFQALFHHSADLAVRGEIVYNMLINDIEQSKNGHDTGLILVSGKQGDHENIEMTRRSVAIWAKKHFDVSIPEWGLPDTDSKSNETASKPAQSLSDKERDKLLIVIALLAEELAKRVPLFSNAGKPNEKNMAEQISQGNSISGFSMDTLRKTLKTAREKKLEIIN